MTALENFNAVNKSNYELRCKVNDNILLCMESMTIINKYVNSNPYTRTMKRRQSEQLEKSFNKLMNLTNISAPELRKSLYELLKD